GYPHFQEQTLEWVGITAGDRHLRDIAFRLILRKSRRAGVGDCGASTGWDPRNRDLAPPFSNLNHQRKASAAWDNWDIPQRERPVGSGQRSHQWRSRGGSVAAIARNTLCKRRHWRVGHVNQRVEDGNLTARIVDGSGDGSGAAVGARNLVALEADAASG